MDTRKSKYGSLPVPSEFVRTVAAQGSTLQVSTRQVGERGESNTAFQFSTDGKPNEIRINGQPAQVIARWIGRALSVETRRRVGAAEIAITEIWTIAPGGRSMVIEATAQLPSGEVPLTIHLDRQ